MLINMDNKYDMPLELTWNQPIAQYPQWEQREILSYTNNITADNPDKVNQILESFKKNQLITWAGLTLNDEAYLQKQLRLSGYGVRCFGLDQFPIETAKLKQVTYRLPVTEYIRHKYYQHKQIISKIAKVLTNLSLINLILVILGLVYFHSSLFWIALLASLVLYNIVIIVMHEGWGHKFITPKNKLIGWLVDILAYMSEFTLEAIWDTHPKQSWEVDHINHHINWKSENAHKKAHWFKVLFLQSFNIGFDGKRNTNVPANATTIDKHHRIIVVSLHVGLLMLLPPIYYFYFVFLQGWLFWRWKKFFNELSTHYSYADWRLEYDRPWLFLLCANAGYHISHHLSGNKIILGNGGVKRYFSIQYWFIKIFFKVRTGIKIT
jgi:hypothetical protein